MFKISPLRKKLKTPSSKVTKNYLYSAVNKFKPSGILFFAVQMEIKKNCPDSLEI